MLSVIINKSVQSDPILINDFSRLAPLISNKLNGAPQPGTIKSKSLNIAMAEQKQDNRNVASSSHHDNSSYSRIRPIVNTNIPRTENKRKQEQKRTEESISNLIPIQTHNPLVQHYNYALGPPLHQTVPWQTYNSHNLVYQQFYQAVYQQNLSQSCFHRVNQENRQRQVQTSAGDVKESSFGGFRCWEQVSVGSPKPGFIFSVMSYNVLAQDLLHQHPYLYSSHKRESLEWQIRWNNLIIEIKQYNPDILCLQEVQGSHIKDYFSQLENLGYQGLYKQRTGIHTDGCAIYYKRDLVNLVEHTTVEYNQPNVRILDRDNVAIIAKFAPKNHPSKQFIVATTHLLYNPRRQDVRLAQTQLLLTEVERIAFTQGGKYLPVIITGDLNSTPDSAIYRFITKGMLKYENLAPRSLQNNTDGPKTGKYFLPSSLRITDQCQHADLIPNRQKKKVIPRDEELKLIELKHSERNTEESQIKRRNNNDTDLFSSGTLSHKFFMKSVYNHVVDGDVEGTTYQNEWITVDYIFYSKKKGNYSKLTLLERYRLPTKKQLGNVKIPNMNLGSDHLSLLAKFKLDV